MSNSSGVVSYDNCLAVIVFTLITALFGAIGNILVLITIFSTRRLRTIPVYGIAALAFTDLLTTLVVQPLEAVLVYYYMHEDGEKTTTFTIFHVFKTLGYYICGTSILVLDYMSLDRYMVICCALWYKKTITPFAAKMALTVVFCLCIIPAMMTNFLKMPFIVEAYCIISALVLLFSIIVICHVAIMIRVWKQKAEIKALQTAQNIRFQSTFQNNKKLAKTVALVVGLFVVCWSPLAFVLARSKEENPFHSESSAWPMTIGLLSSSLNPLVYFYRNKDFRVALKEVLASCRQRCPSRRAVRVHPKNRKEYRFL